MPRIVRELENLQQEGLLLKRQIELFDKDMASSLEDKANAPLQMLVKLDTIKERLSATCKAVKQVFCFLIFIGL